PDLRGVDPKSRAVVVVERQKTAWAFDAGATPETLLSRAVQAAQVLTPQDAHVYSFRAMTTKNPMLVSAAPRAIRGNEVRRPGVAGLFYPSDPEELQNQVRVLFTNEMVTPVECPAIMVPHAGLMYSGKIAAQVFQRVQVPSTVLILGPKHTPLGVEWAVAPHREWQMPV